ncbi:hypothetical protein [Acetoanaerobium noterae]|uniref:hypothetical protein n=1 Tax=Acetoanaerobium noterae TaxID=745369 RepID=UPI0028AD626A|nr:hypothetical protein [Acetoanaerobium noterae]
MINAVKSKFTSIFFLTIILAYMFFNFQGLSSFLVTSDSDNIESIRKSIENAAVQCYALEGHYPPTIDYLKENYSIITNEDAYIYHYEVEASNIMPTILVFKKWKE